MLQENDNDFLNNFHNSYLQIIHPNLPFNFISQHKLFLNKILIIFELQKILDHDFLNGGINLCLQLNIYFQKYKRIMISTKVDDRRIVGKNPFTNSMTPYQKYLSQLQANVYQIKQRFPFEEISKIKALLQQLDNSVEMVAEILNEEQARQIPIKKQINQPKLSYSEQNKILKSAFLRLMRKFTKKEKQSQQLNQKCQKLKKQNEELRLHNKMLLNEWVSHNNIELEHNNHIY